MIKANIDCVGKNLKITNKIDGQISLLLFICNIEPRWR